MNDLNTRLAQAPVFEKLPAKEIDTLIGQAVLKRLTAGDFLCHQGDVWPYAVYVVRGGLRWAILSIGGREKVLFRVEAGQPFWAHSMFDEEPMPASLTAGKASQVLLWSKEVVAPFLSRNPALLWEILRQNMTTMRRAREVIYDLAFKQVAGRLAKLLLEQTAGQEGAPVQREMTLSEIAATVSSSQEAVCRLLYQFQADNIIEINRATFKLNDRCALEMMIEKQ